MTKNKILSAEEMEIKLYELAEKELEGVASLSHDTALVYMVEFLKKNAAQFHPPAMTDDELKKEVESILGSCTCGEIYTLRKLTAPDCVWCNYSESVIELVKASKMGAIKMDRETAEKIWDAAIFWYIEEGKLRFDFSENPHPDKESFLNNLK